MNELKDNGAVLRARREQMLKLVTKSFYNELVNYGVQENEILRVASHLLDNLMTEERKPDAGVEYYSQHFTLATIRDEWKESRQLSVQHVTLKPLEEPLIAKIVEWLQPAGVRESFVPAFPGREKELREYFGRPGRVYFGIYYEELPVGIIGGENIDRDAGKIEMKKLVGERGLQGKGIGKRATFAFLYYTFVILDLNKVYIHSRDTNLSNLTLNSRFGFEVEGVFLDDLMDGGKRQDVVRMALHKSLWTQIFLGEIANGCGT